MIASLRFFRILFRILKILWTVVVAGLTYFFAVRLTGRTGSIVLRAAWLQQQARRFLWALGIEPNYEGQPPRQGVMVSNHVSYLDIIVHAGRMPLVFISKSEVADWPVFGPLTRWAGTLFIRRDLRSDVLRVAAEMPLVVGSGTVLTFFPEGTSSSGEGVLPFRTPLLAPIVENGWMVTPAFVRYALEPGDGAVEEEVAYYKPETVFGPHLLNLLGKRRVRATVTYGQPQVPGSNRKTLANRLRDEVCELGGLPKTTLATEQD